MVLFMLLCVYHNKKKRGKEQKKKEVPQRQEAGGGAGRGAGLGIRGSRGQSSSWEGEKVLEVTVVTAAHSVAMPDATELCAHPG